MYKTASFYECDVSREAWTKSISRIIFVIMGEMSKYPSTQRDLHLRRWFFLLFLCWYSVLTSQAGFETQQQNLLRAVGQYRCTRRRRLWVWRQQKDMWEINIGEVFSSQWVLFQNIPLHDEVRTREGFAISFFLTFVLYCTAYWQPWTTDMRKKADVYPILCTWRTIKVSRARFELETRRMWPKQWIW